MTGNTCQACDLGCAVCTNVTRVCEACDFGYYMEAGTTNCLKACPLGPFTYPGTPNYPKLVQEYYQALNSNQDCVSCGSGCQYCQNITLACLDIEISFGLKEGPKPTLQNQISLDFDLLLPNGLPFLPPSNRGYSYLFKLIELTGVDPVAPENLARQLQNSEFTMPTMIQSLTQDNRISGIFEIP